MAAPGVTTCGQGAAWPMPPRGGRMPAAYLSVRPLGSSGMDVSALSLGSAGKARAWGLVNWPAGRCAQAVEAAASQGIAPPCAVQLPYSLVQRSWVEDPTMTQALAAAGAGLIASFCLAGGVLTGKYRS